MTAARPLHVQRRALPSTSLASITCSSGTYVRTLADDIGAALGGQAHLTALRRTRIGALSVEDAFTIDRLPDDAVGAVVATEQVLLQLLPHVVVAGSLAVGVRNGRPLRPSDVTAPGSGSFCVLDENQTLLAVYAPAADGARPEVVLA